MTGFHVKKSIKQRAQAVVRSFVGGSSKQDNTLYIMLLGETGSGKSTLLNMLVNFFRAKEEARTRLPTVKELKVAVPTAHLNATEAEGAGHSERDKTDRGKSQSTKCIEYIFDYKSSTGRKVKIHVIDTPGLSDTEGADDEHLDKILEAAARLPFISAIILVANGSVARETITIKNVFTLLRGHMPDAVMENTLAVLTNCTSITRNLEPRKLPMAIKPQHLFHMQNSAFSSDPKRWAKATADEKQGLNASWAASMSTVKRMMDVVLSLSAASSAAFADMRKLREQIKSKMASTLSQLRNMQQLEDKLEQAKMLEAHAMEDSTKYKDFTKNETIEEIEIVDASYHSTLCSNCRTVCHDHCSLQETTTQGDAIFAGCACLQGEGNTCTVCEGRCGVSSHYHARKKVQKVEKTVEKVLEDMKKKYQDAMDQMGGAQANAAQAGTDLDMIKQVQQQKMDEVKQLCQGIKAIASGFNLVDELSVVIDGLQMEARQLKSVKARESANQGIKELAAFIDQLSDGSHGSAAPDNDFDYDQLHLDEDQDVDIEDDEEYHRSVPLVDTLPPHGPERTLRLQKDAQQHRFELNPNSEEKDELKKLKETVALLQQNLSAVKEYTELVHAPQRAIASPKAVQLADFAQERLMVQEQELLRQLAEIQMSRRQGQAAASIAARGDEDERSSYLTRMNNLIKPQEAKQVDIQAFSMPTSTYGAPPHLHSHFVAGPTAYSQYGSSHMPATDRETFRPPPAGSPPGAYQQYVLQPEGRDPYRQGLSQVDYGGQQQDPRQAASGDVQRNMQSMNIQNAAPSGVQPPLPSPVVYAPLAGIQGKTLLLQGAQVGNLYKLVGSKGKKRDAIADMTDCKITIPPSEEWDDQLGVHLLIEGRKPDLAEQLILDALR